jgi:hypothetical protein
LKNKNKPILSRLDELAALKVGLGETKSMDRKDFKTRISNLSQKLLNCPLKATSSKIEAQKATFVPQLVDDTKSNTKERSTTLLAEEISSCDVGHNPAIGTLHKNKIDRLESQIEHIKTNILQNFNKSSKKTKYYPRQKDFLYPINEEPQK